uniref:Uncharacterized protein n=1 Tax=Arundo donax TaxID=35708 RepID=A0A0A9DVZ7_ARUDO
MSRKRRFLIGDGNVLLSSQPWKLRGVCSLLMDHAIKGQHAVFLILLLHPNQYASSSSHYRVVEMVTLVRTHMIVAP